MDDWHKHQRLGWHFRNIMTANHDNKIARAISTDWSARIVDCANACEGMEKPAEEIDALRAEVERYRGALIAILQRYELRSELYTSDETLAASLYDTARQALAQCDTKESDDNNKDDLLDD